LQKPDFVDKVVDIINRTRSAKENEPTTSKEVQENGLTNDDLHDILSKTQNDPSFDEIVNDIVNKYLSDYPEPDSGAQTSTSSEKPSELSNELEVDRNTEIPIKQRLRPRSEKKTPVTERKKKINIISNEPYTGVVPAAANLPSVTISVESVEQQATEMHQHVILNLPVFLQSTVPVLQIAPSASLPCTTAADPTIIYQSVTQLEVSELEATKPEVENNLKTEMQKKESTPKIRMHPSFLESKCKSTPRRKATHVRILDFNHTPSNRKLSMIKEFSTPISSGIPTMTPGSAPATIASCQTAMKPQELESVIDDNSNSNSISNTPKVAKNRRRRKIAVSKSAEKNQKPEHQEELKQPIVSKDDWFSMREQSKALPIDQQVRNANEKAEAEGKIHRQKRRTPKRRSVKKKVPARSRNSLTKSPDEQKENKEKNGSEENSTSIEYDENKPLIKFKIKSPRKTAALKNTPKKKKKTVVQRSKEKFEALENQDQKKKDDTNLAVEVEEIQSSLNRSDTVQEVATMLTELSETILANDNNAKSFDESDGKNQPDSGIEQLLETPFKGFNEMLETPFKENSLTPLPNTPRFAIPLVSAHETPMPKIFSSATNNEMSLMKISDIPTPSFPITPGIKETPLKDGLEGSPTSAGGHSSRRTDYSSCSSYYKPDESEDINPALLNPRRRSDRTSQSESDVEKPLKIIGSTKKIECPGAIERVKSFNEEQKPLPTPHYTMMEEGLLSESMVTTATDSSDSTSSFTCSTCSTDPSDEENTMEKLNKVTTTTDVDSEWHCDDPDAEKETTTCSPAVMDEKTGEVRFPLRNWITPKKLEEVEKHAELSSETVKTKSKLNENSAQRVITMAEEQKLRIQNLNEVKQRTLDRIRMDSAAHKQKNQPPPQQQKLKNFKTSNVKSFKLPAEEAPKSTVTSRKEQILQQNLTERPRPTPLKLIPSSSSRRKNATPRKTIVINELPRQPSPVKRKKEKKADTSLKSPSKSDRLSLESVNDNAVMPESTSLYASLNISSSFSTSLEDDSAVVVTNKSAVTEDGSNTFQRTLIAQGFEKNEAKELQNELINKLEEDNKEAIESEIKVSEPAFESESDEDSDDDDEEHLEFVSAEAMKKTELSFVEADNFKRNVTPLMVDHKISPMIINFEGRKMTLKSSGLIEIFTIDPTPLEPLEPKQKEKCSKKKCPKKLADDDRKLSKSNGKDSPKKNGKVGKITKKPENQQESCQQQETGNKEK
jgi:hypothetical protein